MLTWIYSPPAMNSSLPWFHVNLPWSGSFLWQKKRWKKHTWTISRSHESPSSPYRGCQPRGQLFLCWEHQQCAFHGKIFQALEKCHFERLSCSDSSGLMHLNIFLFTAFCFNIGAQRSSNVKTESGSRSSSLQVFLINDKIKVCTASAVRKFFCHIYET